MAITYRKRPSGKWDYTFSLAPVNGKRRRICKGGFRTKAEAVAAGTAALAEYNNAGKAFTPSELSMADFLAEWLADYVRVNCKPTTVEGYQKRVKNYLLPSLGSYYLRTVDTPVIQQLLNEMFQRGLSRNTLSNIKGLLTGSMDYAVRMGYIRYNPAKAARLPLPRAEGAVVSACEPHIVITPEQWSAIMERFPAGHPSHIPLVLGYWAGLRIGEAFGLTWDDIDFEAGTLTVNQQMQYRDEKVKDGETSKVYLTAPKYDSVRTIRLPLRLLHELTAHRQRLENSRPQYGSLYELYGQDGAGNLVPVARKGIPFVNVRECGSIIKPRTMQHTCKVIREELHVKDFDFHSLRKTHATMLIEAGANPKEVQYRLGHKTLKETMEIYAEATPKMGEQAAELLDTIAT